MENGMLAGKTGLVFGVANRRSIAWAIAQAWAAQGARLIFSYAGDRIRANVEELAASLGGEVLVAPCDVSKDEDIRSFFEFVNSKTDRVEVVYDLTVEDAHDFFANGILVLNCMDSLRYCMTQFFTGARGKVVEAKGGSQNVTPTYKSRRVIPTIIK